METQIEVKERPILFSTPMVIAVQDDRKDITRRMQGLEAINGITREVKHSGYHINKKGQLVATFKDGDQTIECVCPYGLPGDVLWVRETWAKAFDHNDDFHHYVYKADGDPLHEDVVWKPSIHMLKEACRLRLKIKSIGVERLQDITEEDAVREGLQVLSKDQGRTYKYGIADKDGLPGLDDTGWPWIDWEISAKKAFQKLWTKINGAESWDSNPWCWRLEFEKL